MRRVFAQGRWLFTIAWLAAGFATHGYSRFDHRDAETVDQEQNLSKEAFLDRRGYLLPDLLRDDYNDATMGLQVSSGSLDAYQFDYLERIKFGYPGGGLFRIRFDRTYQQDVLSTQVHNDLRFEGHLQPFYLGLLLSGDGMKKWGDVGAVLGVENPGQSGLEIFYINVDVYYPSKETQKADTYPQGPWTIGLKHYYNFGDARFRVTGEYDRPMTWQRTSKAYRYQYASRRWSSQLQFALGQDWLYRLEGLSHEKRESKDWTDLSAPRRKKMQAEHHQIDMRFIWQGEFGNRTTLGLMYLQRNVDYDIVGNSPTNDVEQGEVFAEELFSPDTQRTEWISYWYRDLSLSPHLKFRYGYFHDAAGFEQEYVPEQSRYEHGTLYDSTEQKIVTALWILPREDVVVYLNSGWNVDRLVDHFPYDNKPFRPWNGGQFAVHATF